MTGPPTPPYTEATEAAERELRIWASKYVDPELTATERRSLVALTLRAAAPALIAAGRAQAAADIRAHADDEAQRPNRKSSSHLIEEWLREAALIAEGGGEADQSKDPHAP